jgi:hypothetical protein
MNYYFNDLLPLQKDIWEKINKISILDDEISLKRKVIESQPIVVSILQYLFSAGLNEHDILMAFKIFITDMSNNMPYGDRTYLERLSKDLNKYPTVRDTLEVLNDKILLKKSHIDKLALVRSNLEAFLFSLIITIYFYSILLNAQVQIQKNLIKKILLVCVLNYYLLPHFFIVIKGPKKSVRSRFKRQENYNNNNNKKRRRKGKTVTKRKNSDKKKKVKDSD